MNLLSLLLNIGLLAYVAHNVRRSARGLAAPKVGLPVLVDPPNPREKRLAIKGAGVRTVPNSHRGFVRGFGIRSDQLIDLVFYAAPGNIESYPEDVRGCLAAQYADGLAFGVEAMQLVHHSGELLNGQALYFALVSTGQESMPEVVAFVDKVRHPGTPIED
jgi:hypothetical protein